MLVALRGWRDLFRVPATVCVRGDNTGVLSAVRNRSAPAVALNGIMQELALDEALAPWPIVGLTHVPGVANVVADALSRLRASEPKPFPVCLQGLQALRAPVRDERYWHISSAAQRG